MKNIVMLGAATVILAGLLIGCGNPVNADDQGGSRSVSNESTDTTTLPAGGTIGNVDSSAAFTSGANSMVNGYVKAVAGVTIGADSRVNGNIDAGAAATIGANSIVTGNVTTQAAFNLGANGIVNGNVTAAGAVTLGAFSRVTGTIFSGTGVVTLGDGAVVGQ